jgi:tRNA G18 (ribose-2'-O)-methylase SpoU
MGSVLRLPIAAALTAHEAFTLMRKSRVRTIAAVPRGGEDPDAVTWGGKVALLLGGEGPGLTDEAIALCDARVTIPMAGGVESLNVAAAGAILVYAARRQRT